MRKYFFLLFIIVLSFSKSDVQKEHISLNWLDDSNQLMDSYLGFENAFYDSERPDIPVYTRIYNLDSKNKQFNFVLENEVFEEMPDKTELISQFSDKVNIETGITTSMGSKKMHLKIIPFKTEGNKLYRLKSFSLTKIPVTLKSSKKEMQAEWKNNSVLSSGKWVKIQTGKKGIYRIPYSVLTDWGFTNPSIVGVFGSGGTILSEDPGVINYNDLPLNSVWRGNNKGEDCLFFYAQGTTEWQYDESNNIFKHQIHYYSNSGYYFLSEVNDSDGEVKEYEEITEASTVQVTTFDAYELHERELENVLKHGSGRQWYGESIMGGKSETIGLALTDLNSAEDIKIRVNTIGRSFLNSTMDVNVNQVNLGELRYLKVNTGNETSLFADQEEKVFQTKLNTSQADVQLDYKANGSDNNAEAWLDYVEINYRRNLKAGNDPLFFRDVKSVAGNSVAQFRVEGVSADTRIFDVTDHYSLWEVPTELNGSQLSFKRPADELREYVVFNTNGDFFEPELVGEVENQNLHGLSVPEFVIITHSNFYNSAVALADFHRSYDGMSVEVVSAEKVYNEFSSGVKDATGIRNFIKMLYDKSNTLKYVLLMGDGSYDNRNIKSANNNFIPTFQSNNSLSPTSSFITDDYFVILDNGESVYDGAVDLGIGRIPAATQYEAELVVDKIKNYYSIDALGDWKNIVCFIGDDEDGNLHMNDSERLANDVNANHREFVTDKIYFDSYKQVASPAGESYPDVTEAINRRVKDGVLVLNYVGHANNRFMADERVLGISDVNAWSNSDNLPIFVTATCEFSRFDAEETSIGEYVLFNANGGGIGLFSTTRVVFAYSNFLLSKSFYEYVFAKDENGKRYRMGDIMRLAKVNTINTTNKRNFSLLGDPALKLSYPSNKVVTTSINGKDAAGVPDTIGALQEIRVEGYVADYSDKLLNDFTGEITLTIYDKEVMMETLGNGGEDPMEFKVQENIIYKGLASVTNGSFSFSFVVPKDISYKLDHGKIVYYATNNSIDAGGAFENFLIGGSEGEQLPDNNGPDIQAYMDTPNFTNGSKTSKSPTLFASLSDENGINTVGSGIGHDITAVLDGDYSNVLVLNDFYQANVDDYTSGTIVYPMKDLGVGKHTLTIKAWDVANNSTEIEIEFEVSGDFRISTVGNYPNPVNDYTFITFEHNQAGATLDAVIEIFDQSGRRIDIIQTQVGSNGTVTNPIRWDMSESKVFLRNGIYIIRVMAQNEDGLIASKSGKMIVAN